MPRFWEDGAQPGCSPRRMRSPCSEFLCDYCRACLPWLHTRSCPRYGPPLSRTTLLAIWHLLF
ncbi:hypothetical protein LEMLEM_LOCUS8547 [Lemmus lemmus]